MNVWALGDYPRVAREVLGGLGPRLVQACGMRAGQRVLDVGTGSGLAALAAADLGADVVGSDITPELLNAARSTDARVEWVHGDARDLPFDDASFDVVLSCIGAMFAPDHQVVADELLRVCRPGGVVAMLNWTPAGSVGRFFEVFGGSPALSWGSPEYVRSLFGDRVSALTATEDRLPVDQFSSAAEYCAYYKRYFGPTMAAFADAEDSAQLDRRFLAYAEAELRDGFGYDYLLVVATKA